MSTSIQLTGVIQEIDPRATEVGSKGTTTRSFILRIDPQSQYPQDLKMDTYNKTTEALDRYKPGDVVAVDFNITGYKFSSKDGNTGYAHYLKCWRINPAQATVTPDNQRSQSDNPLL